MSFSSCFLAIFKSFYHSIASHSQQPMSSCVRISSHSHKTTFLLYKSSRSIFFFPFITSSKYSDFSHLIGFTYFNNKYSFLFSLGSTSFHPLRKYLLLYASFAFFSRVFILLFVMDSIRLYVSLCTAIYRQLISLSASEKNLFASL